MTPEELAARLGARRSGKGWEARCPAHKDSKASLSINAGHDGRVLLFCHAGCKLDAICGALEIHGRELFPEKNGSAKRIIVAQYAYRDELGRLVFEVIRLKPKGFQQRRPDGNGGWLWRLGETRRVLYCLPELLAAPAGESVWIAEGEKDVGALREHGLIATTNPQGAGCWGKVDPECIRAAFAGRNVIIIPDRDAPGEKHAQEVAGAVTGIALSVKVVHLPEGTGKDASDFLAGGGTAEDLRALAETAPEWSPASSGEGKPGSSAEVIEAPRKKAPAVPAFVAFPTDALPMALARFVECASSTLQVDPAFIALPLLGCLASAIGTSRRLRVSSTWAEPSVVWAVIVGGSGSRKSPALDVVMRPLRKRQALAFADAEKAQVEFEQEKVHHERSLVQWKKRPVGPAPSAPPEPTTIRSFVSDTTVEALAPILMANPRGLLLMRDELSGWLGSFDKYSRGRSDAAAWLEFHRAGALSVDRRGGDRRVLYVPRAAVSIMGGIQPQVLKNALVPEYFASGLAARLLVCTPPQPRRRWTDADIPEEVDADYSRVLDRLWSLELAVSQEGEQYPADVLIDGRAKARWIRFYNEHEEEAEGLGEDLQAAWAKLEGYCARLALILHLARWASGEPVDPSAVDDRGMRAAIRLARWFAGETERTYAALKETEADGDRRRLLDLVLRSGGEMTARDLVRLSRAFRGEPELAAAALADLARHGFGTWEGRPTGPLGGRPTNAFRAIESVDRTLSNHPDETGGQEDAMVSTVDDSPGVPSTVDTTTNPEPLPELDGDAADETMESQRPPREATTPKVVKVEL